MKSIRDLGIGAGGLGIAYFSWNVAATWDEKMTEKLIFGAVAVLAVGVCLIISHLFGMARDRREERDLEMERGRDGGRGEPQYTDGYGRPVQYNAQAAPIVLHSTGGRGRGHTEVIIPPAGGWGGYGQPQYSQGAGQGYGGGYGQPAAWGTPIVGFGQGPGQGFGGGYPGYPQPGADANEGSFRDNTGGNVF